MPEPDVNTRIRELCQQILKEQDPGRVKELLDSLRGAVQAEQDETRLRMSYVAKHYRGRLQAVERRVNALSTETKGTRIRALLDFLGIGSGTKPGRLAEKGTEEEQLWDLKDRGAA
jgi:hypothetical protein